MAEVIIHLWKWFSVHSQTPFRHSWSHLADNNTGYLWASLHSMWEPMGTKCPQALSVIPAGLHKRNLPCTAFLLLFNPTRLSLFFFFSPFGWGWERKLIQDNNMTWVIRNLAVNILRFILVLSVLLRKRTK